ncbi:MAG: transglutaminase-like domain-containing protein [Phycisphaerales bacterium]|nr:transglutaminase-like domain-containing protein [Phycisphaerales bacterium]
MNHLPKLLSVPVCVWGGCLWLSSSAPLALATDPAPPVISHIKILSDKVEDVSSLDAWQKSVIKPTMTDAEKALAIWQTVVKFRHHDSPAPREYLFNDPDVYDAIKLFNVYGYCTGKSAQPAFLSLARAAGFQARHLSIYRFGVPEVFYNNAWHMYDPAMISYFPKTDGSIASVDELVQAVHAWHKANPGYHDNGKKLQAFMKDPGWKTGPALIAACPTLQSNGSYPFSSFGWYSAMVIYDTQPDKPPFVYEEPYSQGYQVNNQLRPGERLTFNWSNKGLHVGMLDTPRQDPASLTAPSGEKSLAYMTTYGDLANQRIGNGTLEYNVPIDFGTFHSATFSETNIICEKLPITNATDKQCGITAYKPQLPASFVVRMPTSYVYLSGQLVCDARIQDGGAIVISYSDNNGLDWKPLATLSQSGEQKIDLTSLVFRRYDYRLKFDIQGWHNAYLTSLQFIHDFQCSQRALPALGQGENTLTFSAGLLAPGSAGGSASVNESTLTIEPAPTKYKDKALIAADYHAVLNNMTENDVGNFSPSGSDASITYTITTPTPVTRLRLGSQYRARGQTHWLYQVSFDQGKTFTTMHQTVDHNRSDFAWITYDKIPANTTAAQVRFTAVGSGEGNLILFHHRIDADYALPSGFTPILATYTWVESGQEKSNTHISFAPADTWKIVCPTKPTMKSLTLERAP